MNATTSSANLAKVLGIEDLRIGRHYIRNAERERIGSLWIDSFWHAQVEISSDNVLVLCAVYGQNEESGRTTCDVRKVALATSESSFAMELERDGVTEALNGFDLFRQGGNEFLDGVSYKISFGTIALNGTLEFGNPTRTHLIILQKALLSVAEIVAGRSNIQELCKGVNEWRSHTDRDNHPQLNEDE
jgi:hypothetical protein